MVHLLADIRISFHLTKKLLSVLAMVFIASLLFIQTAVASTPWQQPNQTRFMPIPTLTLFDQASERPNIALNENLRTLPRTDGSEINLDGDSVRTLSDPRVTQTTCQKLLIPSVTAIGNDGNIPSNAIDGNLNTRWSNNGVGSWIQLDLGTKQNICSVDIAWYRGNERQNDFVISVSNDGTNFLNKFTGKSSGTTTNLEKYNMPAGTEGRYLRITVNGNNENNWASISEIAVAGSTGGDTNPATGLLHKWQTSSSGVSWSEWDFLSETMRNNLKPAAIANSDGRLEVFVIGKDNSLWHGSQNTPGATTNWSPFVSRGGVIAPGTSPVVERNSDGRLEVFVIGSNNQLYHKWQNTAGTTTNWSAFASLGGTIKPNTSPAVIMNSDGRLEVFDVSESAGAPPPPPPPPPPPGGGDAGQNDKFGIKKIYSTKPSGEVWFMNMQDPSNDPRTSEPSMTKNSDGSWRVTSGQVRYGVFTSSGYHPDDIVIDHSVLASRGYMQSPTDWKNVEMTGQVKYNSGGDDEWTWYARGGRHTGSGYPEGCEGVALKGSLAYTGGQVRWAKEQWHVSYVFQPWKNSPADGDGKFVGFKVAIYNMQLNGKTVVKMESWVDPNNNNQWQKVYDFIDQGGWGSEGGECNGAPDQIVTWGGPIASFRWDDGNSIDIKNLSVREIVPPNP